MIWEDDTPRKLLSEDGYVMVATMPRLMDNRGTVSSLPPPYLTKKADMMNGRLKSPIASLNTPNTYNLTWASLLPVRTKQVNMWTGLEKCVEKYDSSKGGLGLGKRCVVNLLIFRFCSSDTR
jgi:hypothetical protein